MNLRVLLAFVAISAAAQESIQYGSISGRVSDATGAVVSNAKVTARQLDTNIASATLTDKEGRFRFSSLKVGPYEIRIQQAGFASASQSVTLSLGSAYELPVVLAVASEKTDVMVSAKADLLEAARTQVAGTVSENEVKSLPLNGRSFLDLALLVPGVSPTNTASNQLFAETSAVPGPGNFGGQPEKFLQQLYRGRAFRERRCGRAERHLLRAGRGAGVPGGDLGRPGGAGARARRLHQYGHQERHQSNARRPVRVWAQSVAQRGQSALECALAANAGAVWRESRRPGGSRPQLLLRELRRAHIEPERADHDLCRQRGAINAQLDAAGYPGRASPRACFRTRCTIRIFWARWITSLAAAISSAFATASTA